MLALGESEFHVNRPWRIVIGILVAFFGLLQKSRIQARVRYKKKLCGSNDE